MVNKKYSFFIIVVTIFLWFLIFFVIPFEETQDEIVLSGETMGTTYEVKFYQNLSNYHQNHQHMFFYQQLLLSHHHLCIHVQLHNQPYQYFHI